MSTNIQTETQSCVVSKCVFISLAALMLSFKPSFSSVATPQDSLSKADDAPVCRGREQALVVYPLAQLWLNCG